MHDLHDQHYGQRQFRRMSFFVLLPINFSLLLLHASNCIQPVILIQTKARYCPLDVMPWLGQAQRHIKHATVSNLRCFQAVTNTQMRPHIFLQTFVSIISIISICSMADFSHEKHASNVLRQCLHYIRSIPRGKAVLLAILAGISLHSFIHLLRILTTR